MQACRWRGAAAPEVERVSAPPSCVNAGLPQVLQRRANLARSRTVHEMHAARLHGQVQYLSLRLRTQAGMYIKEFVHGERRGGRRRAAAPALGSRCPGRREAPGPSSGNGRPVNAARAIRAGDLGRTRPSVSDMLCCRAQLVRLDVVEVQLDLDA